MEERSKVDNRSEKEGNKMTHDDADRKILTGEGESSNNSWIPRKIELAATSVMTSPRGT